MSQEIFQSLERLAQTIGGTSGRIVSCTREVKGGYVSGRGFLIWVTPQTPEVTVEVSRLGEVPQKERRSVQLVNPNLEIDSQTETVRLSDQNQEVTISPEGILFQRRSEE